ncbi:MAG: hypothetical protein ACK4ZJ_10410 [Allorhizobium sp.]
MPYYLVTHTSLVEGDDEIEAAEKVLAKLQSERSLQFVVKSDEVTSHTVTVVNQGNWQAPEEETKSSSAQGLEPTAPMSTDKVSLGQSPGRRPPTNAARDIAIAIALFAVGLLFGAVIH